MGQWEQSQLSNKPMGNGQEVVAWPYGLRIRMKDWDDSTYMAVYDEFKVISYLWWFLVLRYSTVSES